MSVFDLIRRGDAQSLSEHLAKVIRSGQGHTFNAVGPNQESILHRAVKLRANPTIIAVILEQCPNLLTESRQSDEYRGQTALHIAITDGNVSVAETLLHYAEKQGKHVLSSVLSTEATGTRFENTVMLGELPLAVAALTLNIEMFNKLVQYGASLHSKNTNSDTLFHSLVKYAHLYPENQLKVLEMFEHASETCSGHGDGNLQRTCMTDNFMASNMPAEDNVLKQIWKIKNCQGYNVLQLAAKLGRHAIFKTVMEMKNVYCYVNSEDGLFDVELYDVTDIDSLADYSVLNTIVKAWDSCNQVSDINSSGKTNNNDTDSVRVSHNNMPTLEMIIDNDPSTVFKFIELSPLRYVINRKWSFYRWFFFIWAVVHVMFMIGYTVYAVRRSDVKRNVTETGTPVSFYNTIGDDGFVTFYAIVSLVFAGLYLFQEVLRMYRGRMPWTISHVVNCHHNGPLRLVLIFFCLMVIGDFIWRLCDTLYEDYLLVVAMIFGWWFTVFFLRGFRQFSFFTVMIQKVVVGDMFRFSIIIGMELIAFTTGLFIVFRGQQTEDENVSEYSKLIVMMFKMMFGFTSMDVLFQAPSPWFAVGLYIAFILLTYVLMINSLIAMMSNTCAVVSQNREIQYRVQQLSIILFFESIFPIKCLKTVGELRKTTSPDGSPDSPESSMRMFMEVKSLHEVTKSKSRHLVNTETMLETIFHTIKNIKIPNLFENAAEETVSTSVAANATSVGRVSSMRVPLTAVAPLRCDASTQDSPPEGDRSARRHKKKKKRRSERTEDNGGMGGVVNVVSAEPQV